MKVAFVGDFDMLLLRKTVNEKFPLELVMNGVPVSVKIFGPLKKLASGQPMIVD